MVITLLPTLSVPLKVVTVLHEESTTRMDTVSEPGPAKVVDCDMVMVPPCTPAMVVPGRMPWPAIGAPTASPATDETSLTEVDPLLTLPVKEMP